MSCRSIIQSYYAAFNKGDFEAMAQLVSVNVHHDINQSEPNLGIEAFRKFMKMMDQHYKESVEDLIVFAEGDRAAAEFFIRGTYLRTAEGLPPAKNQQYYLRVGAFFEIKDSKITRITNYYNLHDWIRQVS